MGKLGIIVLCTAAFIGYKFYSGSSSAISKEISAEAVADLKSYGNETGKTIVCFGASWCPACRAIEPQLERFVKSHSDYTLKKIDIVEWNSPIATKFSIRSIPYLVLIESGKIQAEGKEVIDRLNEALSR